MNQQEKNLLEKRGQALQTLTDIGNTLRAEGRAMTSEEKQKFDAADAEFESMNSALKAIKRSSSANTAIENEIEVRASNQGISKEERAQKDELEKNVFTKYLVRGKEALTTEERKLMLEIQNANKLPHEERTLDISAAGATIPQGFMYQLSEALKAYGGVREVAGIITTDTGNDYPYPCVDDTSIIGELVTETGANATTGSDPAFDKVTFKAYKWGSKVVKVTTEMIQDSAFDLQAYLVKAFAIRIGRIENNYFTTGTGTAQPKGVVTAASGSGVTNAALSAIAYEDLLNLFHAVDPLYRTNAKWMFNDTTLKYIKEISIGTNFTLPLWMPNIVGDAPDTIMGKAYQINQSMDTVGASKVPVLFGDFDYYKVRNVTKGTLLTIFRELYMVNGEYGFLLNQRSDGNLASIGAPIKKLTCASS